MLYDMSAEALSLKLRTSVKPLYHKSQLVHNFAFHKHLLSLAFAHSQKLIIIFILNHVLNYDRQLYNYVYTAHQLS